jgi:sensor histidine kinase regulating citrate/malate metabolism
MQNIGLNALVTNSVELLKICVGISWIMALLVVILVLMFLYQRISTKNKEIEYNAINLKNDVMLKNLRDLTDNYKDMAQNYHDYNNQLSVIYGLVLKNKNNDALEYMRNLNKVSYQDLQYVDTPFEIINTVLNNKIGYAKKNSIDVIYDIDIDQRLIIPQNDLATILYNLLDNAIEANMKIENHQLRKIFIKIKMVHSMVFVIVENAMSGIDEVKNKKSLLRGYGLSIVEKIVDKYNGVVDKTISLNEYKVCLFFNNIDR